MIYDFIDALRTCKPGIIPKTMIQETVREDENLVIYEISMAVPTASKLASVAKLLLEPYTKNEFDLIISIVGSRVSFSIYLRVDGCTFAPMVINNPTFFKVRGILVDGVLHIGQSEPPRSLSTSWVSEHPYAYFVIGGAQPVDDKDMIALPDGAFTIPIPETILRAICVRERIPLDSVKRSPTKDTSLSLFKAILPGNHSQLYVVSSNDTIPIPDEAYTDIVMVEKDTVQLSARNVQIRVDAAFFKFNESTPEFMEGVVRHVFYDNV